MNPFESPATSIPSPRLHTKHALLSWLPNANGVNPRFVNASFILALAGPPIACMCLLSGVPIGLWDQLGRFLPLPIVLLLYWATPWLGVVLAFAAMASAIVTVLYGRWWQRVTVIVVPIGYVWFAPALSIWAFLVVIPIGMLMAMATLIVAAYGLVNLLQGRHRFATLVTLAIGGPILFWTVYEVLARVTYYPYPRP